jgi:hypothetical protein
MKNAVLLSALAVVAARAGGQTAAPVPPLHTHTSFEVTVNLPLNDAAHLFTPEGERGWAGEHWNPEFLYPQPARDMQGAVFTIRHGNLKATWVNTISDLDARHFQYVYFLPDLLVTAIDVHFTPLSADRTAVHIDYARTALTTDGNPHVQAMTKGDQHAGADWQKALDSYLGSKSKSPAP